MINIFRKRQGILRLLFSIIVFGVMLNACFGEAKSLKKGEVYRLLNGREAMEVISSRELEITEGEKTIVAEYDFKGDKLRVVANVKGTKMVKYYLLIKEGLKDEKSGEVYYSKAALTALEEKWKREKAERGKAALATVEKGMVLVKGGCYQMGDTFGDGDSNEKPVHEVCLDDFYIGKYEVTQGQWEAIMGNNPSHFSSCGDNCPVERVSWNDAQDFINKLNQKTGKNYRLPTEAEWEYAARSGGKNEKYSGGNDVDSVAWYNSNSGRKTHPVGTKAPNGLGIHDMSGNVWEWVNDWWVNNWYDGNYYKSSPKDNPKGPSSGSARVLRGGSWFDHARFTRSAVRYGNNPDLRDFHFGFRLVRTQ